MSSPKNSPSAFFDEFHHTYLRAEHAAGNAVEYDFLISGYRVRLRFAGSSLVPLITPSLEHLSVPATAGPPDLTVCLWDSYSTGIQLPPCPWRLQDVQLRGEITGYTTDNLLTVAQPDTAGAVSMLDHARNLGLYRITAGEALRSFERAAPLKIILHAWLARRGLSMIHAGAVGTAAGAVLITGKSGSGKSTASLACTIEGLNYISDDRCLVSLQREPEAHCIYNCAKLHTDQITRFPQLVPHISNPHESAPEKSLVYMHQYAPDRLTSPLPVKAVLLARIAHRPETTLSPVGGMELLRELATSTLVYQPAAAHAEVRTMADLVRRVPCYRINLGYKLEDISPVVAQLIDRGGRNL